ncbi:MAG: 3-methyl-2-oxobutanoate hydroxymethyltransferase [bacterium]|nr:3-methyl-2-oxobutanoate hydroxymethyltransferase [bacterium]
MPDRVTVPEITKKKGRGSIVMVTAYDAPTTRWGEGAGAEILLVGDSLSMVVLGYSTTLDVTLDEMLHHARAVSRTARRALLVGDLPFGSYQGSAEQAVASATRFVKESGMHAVKLEGLWPETVRALTRAGIPVMGHLGLTPQSFHQFGGYRVQGRTIEAAKKLVAAARELQEAGCFSIVLEGIPAEVASVVTKALAIPTIGIGAGVDCDGQVLVVHDLLGMSEGPLPRFVAGYADIEKEAIASVAAWAADVRSGNVPTDKQSYHLKREDVQEWRKETEDR